MEDLLIQGEVAVITKNIRGPASLFKGGPEVRTRHLN